jgi:hypothetical protein
MQQLASVALGSTPDPIHSWHSRCVFLNSFVSSHSFGHMRKKLAWCGTAQHDNQQYFMGLVLRTRVYRLYVLPNPTSQAAT